MNNEEYSKEQPISDEDLNTTPPNPASAAAAAPKKQGAWQMPEPVFRKTSGYLPQGFVKPIVSTENEESAQSDEPEVAAGAEPPVPAAPAIAVEPQPEISELLALDEISDEPVVAVKRSGSFRAVLMVLGVLAMFIFLAVFLAVVYFLFLSPSKEINF